MDRSEFMLKYGHVEVSFSSYYKYTFTYSTIMANGDRLSVGIGGDADAVYRLEVLNNETLRVSDLDPHIGRVSDSNKNAVCDFIDV